MAEQTRSELKNMSDDALFDCRMRKAILNHMTRIIPQDQRNDEEIIRRELAILDVLIFQGLQPWSQEGQDIIAVYRRAFEALNSGREMLRAG